MLDSARLKIKVKEHWESETCGIRYGSNADRRLYFDEISSTRYALEPFIPSFADFESANGKAVLEIGVGAGADFQNWCQHAAHATGIDLTERAIALTGERLGLNSVSPQKYSLRTADAENLPFPDNSFDIVYSWGVLHHSPNTDRAFQEVFRVLKPGGSIKAMIYHVHSWTGLLLYLQHAAVRGKIRTTMKEVMFHHLESPGTKAYTISEARELLERAGFLNAELSTKLGPSDLLAIKPSEKYNSPLFKMALAVYPRWLVRMMGDAYGLYLLMSARKPASKQ